MKTATLILLAAGMAMTAEARQFKFKDGTVLNAKIRHDGAWAPDTRGLVLTVGGRVYIHHYPATANAVAPPAMTGRNVPSRIQYRHFANETLHELSKTANTQGASIGRAAYVGILAAMTAPRGHFPANSARQSQHWQQSVEHRIGYMVNARTVSWGRHVAMASAARAGVLMNVQQGGGYPSSSTSRPFTGVQQYPRQPQVPIMPRGPHMATLTLEVNPMAMPGYRSPLPPPRMPPPRMPHYDNCTPSRSSFMTGQALAYSQPYYHRR